MRFFYPTTLLNKFSCLALEGVPVVRALARAPGRGFDFQARHVPGLQGPSLALIWVPVGSNQSMCVSHIYVSVSPSIFSTKIGKQAKETFSILMKLRLSVSSFMGCALVSCLRTSPKSRFSFVFSYIYILHWVLHHVEFIFVYGLRFIGRCWIFLPMEAHLVSVWT